MKGSQQGRHDKLQFLPINLETALLINEPSEYKYHLHLTKKYLPDENQLNDNVELNVVSDMTFESLGQRPEKLFDPTTAFRQVSLINCFLEVQQLKSSRQVLCLR